MKIVKQADIQATLETANSNVYFSEFHEGVLGVNIEMIDQLIGIGGVYYTLDECLDSIARCCDKHEIKMGDEYTTFVEVRHQLIAEQNQVRRRLQDERKVVEVLTELLDDDLKPDNSRETYRILQTLNEIEENRSTDLYALKEGDKP